MAFKGDASSSAPSLQQSHPNSHSDTKDTVVGLRIWGQGQGTGHTMVSAQLKTCKLTR